MEHQDKIFEQFKKAAENQETQDSQDFMGMEKVWSRVDAKLDTHVFKAQKKTNTNWKKFAVAASVVVGSLFAFQLWKQFDTTKEPIQNSVVETVKNEINLATTNDSTAIVTTEESVINNKQNEKILQQQINGTNQVVISENKPIAADSIQSRVMAAPVMEEKRADVNSGYYHTESAKKSSVEESDYKAKEESAQSVTLGKKASPLVIVDGKATDKKVSDVKNSDDLETIVELKEPLYIINGKEYSEMELFGPNPTSAYYPLNKQEIESISIHQDEEAIELYGEKGKKGVVVIKTKNGKPKSSK
ncbi:MULTISPECIES: hypothetical protein [Flavobacterium]|uniref:TonB-dependent receptor plug domain-containing protein n=1 Tax=Flavobacterium hankyongi TaxID=1176532 RepID=A0ABP9A7S5_9FLAO|nr:hypothetical protein [Flavobacterium sp. N1846]